MFTDSMMMIISCPEVTVVVGEHTVTCKARCVCPQNIDVVAVRKISSVEDDSLETDARSASGDMDAVHRHKALSALGWIVTIL
jgi:uncharacterized Fe-S radical SAM superfamily protein PflX